MVEIDVPAGMGRGGFIPSVGNDVEVAGGGVECDVRHVDMLACAVHGYVQRHLAVECTKSGYKG